jgi:hypothetical protein
MEGVSDATVGATTAVTTVVASSLTFFPGTRTALLRLRRLFHLLFGKKNA